MLSWNTENAKWNKNIYRNAVSKLLIEGAKLHKATQKIHERNWETVECAELRLREDCEIEFTSL